MESQQAKSDMTLGNNVVFRRINGTAEFFFISAGEFATQINERIDTSNCAVVVIYVRYDNEDDFLKDMLCCLTFPRIYQEQRQVMNDCIIVKYNLYWVNCKEITTDGKVNVTEKQQLDSDKNFRSNTGLENIATLRVKRWLL